MGDTNISSIGKILTAQQGTVIGSEKQSQDIKVSFSDMMSQTGVKNANSLATDAKNQLTADPARKNDTPVQGPVDDYKKYQYKDNLVETKQEIDRIHEGEQVTEEVAEYADAVKNVLKEELGVTDEEIQDAMEVLGLNYVDLLNQNNLANLVAELTGCENVSQLLCNEQFLNVLQSVNSLGQELLQNLQLTPEELMQICDQMATIPEDVQMSEETPMSDMPAQTEIFVQESVTDEASTMTVVTNEAGKSTQTVDETKADTQTVVTEEAALPEENVEVPVADAKTNEDAQSESDDMLNQQTKEAVKESKTDDAEHETLNIKGLFEDRATQNVNGAETVSVNQNTALDQLGSVETVQNLPEYVTVQDIIDQIVDTTRVTLTNEVSKIEMQLNPENLGKIYVEITEREGVLSAKLEAQNLVVKEALETQMAELRQNLNQAGVRVDEVEVTIASHEFERNLEQDAKGEEQQAEQQQKAMRSRRINLNNLDELSGLMTEEETLVAKMMAEQGNSVDYTA